MGSTEPCIFCGQTGGKLTLEHVLPKWLRQVLPLSDRDLQIVRMIDGVPVRGLASLDVTLRDVCESCNGGWLSDLEAQFASIMEAAIQGGQIELDEAQERTVALWSLKTWFLLVRAWGYLKVSPMAFGMGDFRLLFEEQAPPPWFQVWIGRVLLDDHTVVWLSNQLVQPQPDRPPIGLVGVMAIGCVLFHIYGPFPRTKDDGIEVMALGLPSEIRRLLRPVFPHADDLSPWEPDLRVPATQLEKFWPSGGQIQAVGSAPAATT